MCSSDLNLDFIMNTPEYDFSQWLDTASDDDINYALELVRKSKLEKMIEIIELQDLTAQHEDEMEDANKVLRRIMNV